MVRGYGTQGVLDFRVDGIDTSRKRFSALNALDRENMERFFTAAYPNVTEREELSSGIQQKASI